jgi:hypothetical protein
MLKLAALVVLAACEPVATPPNVTGTTNTDSNRAVPPGGCPDSTGVAWQTQATSQPHRLLELENGLTVDIVEYPVPDYDAKLWSQWGQGAVMADGTFISAVGDHDGPDGNSFFFAFDPDANTITRFSDVLSLVDHRPGDFGYGKVHAQMVVGACGEVYAHTYWGTRRGLEYNDGYRGDLLLRIDPGSIEVLGVTAEGRGTASMAGTPDGATLFLEMVEPETNQAELVVYDLQARQPVAVLADPHIGNRALAVGGDDQVYFSSAPTRLSVVNPATRAVETIPDAIPGEVLRAATSARADGSVIGVTRDPDEFFILQADGSVQSLASAAGYTASLAISADGRHVYYVPGAHGNSGAMGTPVMDLDAETGQQSTLVELFDSVAELHQVRLGGSYNVVLDPDGGRLYVGLNAGEGDETFGRVFLAIINLP